MQNSLQIANSYANALFELAKEEEKVRLIYTQINELRVALQTNPEFIDLLRNLSLEFKHKEKMLNKLFKDSEMDTLILNFLKVMVKNNKSSFIMQTIEKFQDITLDFWDYEKGIIYTTYMISGEIMRKIEKYVESKINKKIILSNKIDPSIIGGVKIVVGDKIFENSVVSQLNQIKEHIIKEGR